MNEFRKHDFELFKSAEELQEALARKQASMLFEATNEGVSIDEFLKMNLQFMLIEAVYCGLRPTFLVKDRLEGLLTEDVDGLICAIKGEKIEGFSTEEDLKMFEVELEMFKGMTEQEIYDDISDKGE